MAEEQKEKMVIIATHGCDEPERATLPFVMGNAALVMDADVVIALQGAAVTLAKKGCYEHVFAGGLDPLKKLVASFLEQGGKIWVCTPCINHREITPDMLIDGAEPVTGGKLVTECLQADSTLSY